MKNSTIVMGLVSLMAMGLSACGSSSGKIKGAAYCKSDYATKSMKVDVTVQAKKTSLKPDTKLALTAGSYKLLNAEFYVEDKTRDIRLHVVVAPRADGTSDVKLNCIGGTLSGSNPNVGVHEKMAPFTVTLPVTSLLEVTESQTSQMSLGNIVIDLRNRPGQDLVVTYAAGEKASDGELKDVYSGYDSTTQFLYEYSNKSLELRSSFAISKGGGSGNNATSTVDKSVIGVVRLAKQPEPKNVESQAQELN